MLLSHKGTPFQRCTFQINRQRPAGIIESTNRDAILVLPVTIALGGVPCREP